MRYPVWGSLLSACLAGHSAREALGPVPPMSAAVRSKQIDNALEFLAFALDMYV